MDLLGVVATLDHGPAVALKMAKIVLLQTAIAAADIRIKVHLNQLTKTGIQYSQAPFAGLYLGAEMTFHQGKCNSAKHQRRILEFGSYPRNNVPNALPQ